MMGFKPEICTPQFDSWSEQTYSIKARFQVTNITGLESLDYQNSCECNELERPPENEGPPRPCQIVFMVDGSESMEDSDFMKEAFVFMKKFAKSIDRDVLKKRHQQPITFTIVQFSGCSQLTKYYEPGHGFYGFQDFVGKTKLTKLERETTFKSINFTNRLGMAGPGSYHWKSYSTLSARTITDEHESEKETSFEKQIRKQFKEQKMLNGNSQLFLCLQDISATGATNPAGEAFTTSFQEHMDEKMKKYTDEEPKRILIMLTDDKAFDDSEVQDLQLYHCDLDEPTAQQKKEYILNMAKRSYSHIYPIVLKTGKAQSTAEIEMLHASANVNVELTIDPKADIDHQMKDIKKAIIHQLGFK